MRIGLILFKYCFLFITNQLLLHEANQYKTGFNIAIISKKVFYLGCFVRKILIWNNTWFSIDGLFFSKTIKSWFLFLGILFIGRSISRNCFLIHSWKYSWIFFIFFFGGGGGRVGLVFSFINFWFCFFLCLFNLQ